MNRRKFQRCCPASFPPAGIRLGKLALCVPAAWLLCVSCSWFGEASPLPVRVEDRRTFPAAAGTEACVDVFAVAGGNALNRALATPADEYFRTLGLPSRPRAVWRCRLDDASSPRVLEPGNPLYRVWCGHGADTLVAVCSVPRFRHPVDRDRRMVAFPLRGDTHASGTKSLVLTLTDAGLAVTSSHEPVPSSPDSTTN